MTHQVDGGPVFASAPGQKPVLRGKIQQAHVEVEFNGKYFGFDLDLERAPYQINNMSAWYIQLLEECGNAKMERLGKVYQKLVHFSVNEGKGPKTGRGSHENTFEYRLHKDEDYFYAVIQFKTISHQLVYHREIKEGIRKPKPKFDKYAGPYVGLDGRFHYYVEGMTPGGMKIDFPCETFEQLLIEYPELQQQYRSPSDLPREY